MRLLGEVQTIGAARSQERFFSLPKLIMMFPQWPKDYFCVKKAQTYRDSEAIPEDLRTKKEHKEDDDDGGFHDIAPITTLRRCYLGVYAEIVRIEYWIGYKNDGTTFYQVNLVNPTNLGFNRKQEGTISLDCQLDSWFNDFEATMKLLADAKRFIEWYEKKSAR